MSKWKKLNPHGTKEKSDWLTQLWFHGTEKQFSKWIDDICLLKSSKGFELGTHQQIREGVGDYLDPAERALKKLEELIQQANQDSEVHKAYISGLGTARTMLRKEINSRHGF